MFVIDGFIVSSCCVQAAAVIMAVSHRSRPQCIAVHEVQHGSSGLAAKEPLIKFLGKGINGHHCHCLDIGVPTAG
jgi:hypothetical protein